MNYEQSTMNDRYFLVIDLEATCCDLKLIPRREMEIIEIGAVMLETSSLKPIAEFQTFIKPVRHPILTDFCKQLTSITQEQVDRAPTYPEAMRSFQEWLFEYPKSIFGSWGEYDRKQFLQDSKFHSLPLPYPLSSKHINLKQLFSENQGLPKKYGMAQALELAGIELIGTHHRGIDDSRNIATLLPYILGREKLS
jgi:inhibitor of KinA sporulation pathway (predicted exonuclease)